MDLFEKCRSLKRAEDLEAAGLYPYFKAIQSGAGSEVVVNGRKMIMIGSNNYLGLTQHPHVKEAAIRAIERYGSGCTGSRFLNGTLDLHEELEDRLAKFMGTGAALCFSTGFQTNQGTIATLVGKDDVAVIDRDNHASIIDGCRLAFGRTVKYRHNDVEDAARLLAEHSGRTGGVLLVTDGVFSMQGDLAPLPALCRLKQRYEFRIMVDDAHGIGVMGPNGRGTAEHFGCEKDVDLVMGTFSKSFASIGGFIAGRSDVVRYIKHLSRSLIFSASMPPAAVATVIAALDIIQREPERRERLWKNARRMKAAFDEMGFNTGASQAPVIPIILGDEMLVFSFWRSLFEEGIFANPVIAPAVPPDLALIRTSYMATHTDAELDRVLETFKKLGKKFGILGKPSPAPVKARVE
jgi:8-amino-7-oxononanoate synthase